MKTIFKTTILLLLLVSSGVYGQRGIGTNTPDPAAILDLETTTKGLLLPRLTIVQRDAIVSPVAGLIVYCIDCGSGEVSFFNGSIWSGSASVIVTSPTGSTWMARNLGASQVATSSTDAASYGDLYQWGRDSDGHQIRTSSQRSTAATSATAGHGDFIKTVGATDFNWTNFAGEDTLWQSGLNDPCPAGYRVPTQIELDTERLSWTNNNAAGAMNSPLKLPLAGTRRRASGAVDNEGSTVSYWSSTVNGVYGRRLNITGSSADILNALRGYGNSVRCIKED